MAAVRAKPDAEDTFEVVYEMSRVLNCGLDRQTLAILMKLCDNGVNPEALAEVVKELRRETAALKQEEERDYEAKQ
eukprot:CAMPEP_0197515086 /NCGR_PEP_ID=MMETSP1318-20131121/322_1 /TAXON_ID=552666 /ORGANISM="Partenskyella glossopodia, Strain RCC365" /LENGTH=75 /DNA_ID=CAMNT_0043063353 /DNA_START=36 /DNA_END=263 /DNA_ORIENTATION=+